MSLPCFSQSISARSSDNPEVPPPATPRESGPAIAQVGTDPVRQEQQGTLNVASVLLSFEGAVEGRPDDPNIDVGPNHVMQMINFATTIYDKHGNVLLGPVPNPFFWQGFGGACETANGVDPIVLYDHLADRWLVSIIGQQGFECVAVSATTDPTGSWHRYAFDIGAEPDYPKFGVWPDAYYLSVDIQAGGFLTGDAKVFALERDRMLAGEDTRLLECDAPSITHLLPADLDGPAPPTGTPNIFAVLSGMELQLWEFAVDWTHPEHSTFTLRQDLAPEPFDDDLCFGGSLEACIDQPHVTEQLIALSDRLMWRLQYRHFGLYQTMVTNHTVDATGTGIAGVRWYELRTTGGDWFIYQQGTYAPDDGTHRWMGSIAMNGSGDIALGYSVSSASTFPSIRFTGQTADQSGTGLMNVKETTILNGRGAQTGPGVSSRLTGWGDYTSMMVDPSDDAMFWYTNQYLTENGPKPRTSIAALTFAAGHDQRIVSTLGDNDDFRFDTPDPLNPLSHPDDDMPPRSQTVLDLFALRAPEDDAVLLDQGGTDRPVGLTHYFFLPPEAAILSAQVAFRVRGTDALVYNDNIVYQLPGRPVITLKDLLGIEPQAAVPYTVVMDLAHVPVRTDPRRFPTRGGAHWPGGPDGYRDLRLELRDGQLDLVFADDVLVDYSTLTITYRQVPLGIPIETDSTWRAIGPVGNREGQPLTQVGEAWEHTHEGWNTEVAFDDSAAAGWTTAVVTAAVHPPRPDLQLIWVNDPTGTGQAGNTPAYFRKTFTLEEVPRSGRLTLLVDDDAQVYVNGHRVIDDRNGGVTFLGNVEVAPFLRAGPNLLAVKAHDSFGINEGLYLSLRVGSQELVNPLVALVANPSTYVTDPHPTAGCPAGYVGTFHFQARLTNTSAPPLTGVAVEIERLDGGNLLLVNDGTGLAGAGNAADVVPRVGAYADGVLDNGEAVNVPFTVCLRRIAPFGFVVNVLGITDEGLVSSVAGFPPLQLTACPGSAEQCQ
jgi:hypothetical protein